jgi:hypothetical protein
MSIVTRGMSLLAQVNISIEGMVSAFVYCLVLGAVVWLLLWLIGYIGVPEPFNKVARVIIMVIAVLILIGLLLSFVGHPMVNFH